MRNPETTSSLIISKGKLNFGYLLSRSVIRLVRVPTNLFVREIQSVLFTASMLNKLEWTTSLIEGISPPLRPGFDSRTRHLMKVKFVVGSRVAPRVFLHVL